MRKNFLKNVSLMLALSMVFSCSVGLAACGQTPKPDQDQSRIDEPQNPDDKEPNKPSGQPSEDNRQDEIPDSSPDTDSSEPTTPEEQKPSTPEEQIPPEEDEKEPVKPEEQEKPEDPKKEEKEEPDAGQDEGQKDEEKEEPKEEEKHAHSFSAWISDNKGNHSRTCVCGEKQTETCTLKRKTVSPTCVADGYTLNYCEKCNYSYQTDTVKSNGEHVWTFTFTSNGLNSTHTRTCSACGEKQAAEKCNFTDEVIVSPTCTEDGYYKYTCSVCRNQIQSSTSRAGRTAQTKKGHDLSKTWAPDDDALTHSKTCQNAGCNYKETQDCTITKTETAATCSKAGSKTSTCNICNRNTTETIEKLPHTFGDWTQEAKIEKHKHTCTVCGQVQMEACTFGDSVVKDATCTTSGKTTTTCTKCGKQKIETTPATGHEFEGKFTGKPSGHSAICKKCNQEITKNHTYEDTNFCTVCHYDGLSYNFRSAVYVERSSTGTSSDNSINKNATTIYIAKNPYASSDLQTYAISAKAFANNKNLRDIYIPDCLYTISGSAFEGCTNLVIHYEGPKDEWDEYFNKTTNINPVDGSNITLSPNDYKYPSAEEMTNTVSALPEAILPERRFYL